MLLSRHTLVVDGRVFEIRLDLEETKRQCRLTLASKEKARQIAGGAMTVKLLQGLSEGEL